MTKLAIENIVRDGTLLAIILRREYRGEGVHFFTPERFSQQLAYMQHPAGVVIDAHIHNHVSREVTITQETLILRSGLLRVDFYDQQQKYLESKLLRGGDVILLIDGGHGFEVLEDVEMIEIKQGPFVGEQDKTRFTGISAGSAVVKE
jgi:hypothetical protein